MFKEMFRKGILSLSVITLMGSSGLALAASEGSISQVDSTGSTDISLTIPHLIKVTAFTDIALGTWLGSGDKTGTDDICVYDNAGGQYTATFTGSGAGSAFTLVNGSDTVAYSVKYKNVTATATTTLTGQTGAHETSLTCAGGTNGAIEITVAEADMSAVPANAYTGTLTMVVAPE